MPRIYHQTEAETSSQRSLSVPNAVRRQRRWSSLPFMGCQSFTLAPIVSHGRRPDGSWGLTYRVPAAAAWQYPEIEWRTPPSCPVPWQEDGAA